MSLESVKVESKDTEQQWEYSVKREPKLGPELLQAPDVAWPREGTRASLYIVKQELSVEGPSGECTGNKTEASARAGLHQEHSIKIEMEIQPECVKKEETEEKEHEKWSGVSETATRAGVYAGHAVKRDLVLGPELLQTTHIASLPGTSAEPRTASHSSQALTTEGTSGECPAEGPSCSESRPEQLVFGTCSVGQERMSVENAHTCKQQLSEQAPLMTYRQSVMGAFPNHATVNQHKQDLTAKKSHKCHVCGKLFSRSDSLKIHCRIHTGEKLYECDVCNKQFKQLGHLKGHKLIHTGEKTYTCNICNKQFTHKGNLNEHKRIHTREKPYTCDICNKQFAQCSSLSKHKRIHTGEKPYVCDICNKQFTQLGHLTEHKRIHTGDKPYACDICNKQFHRSSDLVSHKRIHTREKPYACDICNEQFTYYSSLHKHKRIHT